jgi:hypothetical protein
MQTLSQREEIQLNKKGALYWSADHDLCAVCTVSKRYEKGRPPYWYGYDPEWRKLLSEGKRSFLVLGCMDRDTGYAIPFGEIEKVLVDLYRTPNKHWHIVLDEDGAGSLDLLTRTEARVSLRKFEIQ